MMKFSKMHGIGNDYVYVNCFKESVDNPEEVSRLVSDRRKGIGADGLILILPSEIADCRMRIFNADGSEAMMCGNGIRCVGKYVYDYHIIEKTELSVETNSGIKYLQLQIQDGKAVCASVDMGKAIMKTADIPMRLHQDSFINQPIIVHNKTYLATAVSIGNPHCVLFMKENIHELALDTIGPSFEYHELFPERVNTEFINVLSDNVLQMRVWERGSGETMACGTGACAAAVAAVWNGYCQSDKDITVKLLGGDLHIRYQSDNTVIMTGSATHVFDGEIAL